MRAVCGQALALLLIGIAGCGSNGQAIRNWTIDVDAGPHGVPITLPSNLFGELALRDADFSLRTVIALTDEQRGRPLTLVFECFHAPLSLTVDDTPVPDDGYLTVGEHRYLIGPSLSSRSALTLTVAGHHDWDPRGGFPVEPRLVTGIHGRSGVAAFNLGASLVGMILCGFLGFMYGTLFLLDRRRSEYAALSVALLFGGGVLWLWTLGLLPMLLGPFAPSALVWAFAVGNLGILYFLNLTFELGPPRRIWLFAWGLLALVAVTAPLSFQLALISVHGLVVCWPAFGVYVTIQYARLARNREHRAEALILLVGYIVLWSVTLPDLVMVVSGHHLFGGLHTSAFALPSLMTAHTIVLSRQHVARQRAIERTTAELRSTVDELRHQVVKRSRELGNALSRLAQQPPQPIGTGRTIDGRYRVIEKLGAGGMGAVYKVERLSDGKHLALKTLRGRVDANLMTRFAREAQIAAELQHPNLVPVIDVGVADGSLYLVMNLIEGGSLERQRARFGNVTWAGPILSDITEGLAAIHARGITHRDLKPANILLAPGGAQIADFGLASLRVDASGETAPSSEPSLGDADTAAADSPPLTKAGDVFGTPAYMAPELADGARDAGPASDVFAFGVIAYELLSGKRPFGEHPIISRQAGRPIASPAFDVVDSSLRDVVVCCLDLDPGKRPRSDELAKLLW